MYGTTTVRPASPVGKLLPASTTIQRPARVRSAIASPCPTSSRCSSVSREPTATKGSPIITATQHDATRIARAGRSATQPTTTATAATPATAAASVVGSTTGALPGTAAAYAAMASNVASSACAASAANRSTPG